MPKFSVLIPTRNRLKYLKHAVNSVIKQEYEDWEIIISDNDSEEDIQGYVTDLNNPKVKYFRTTSFIPVTDNWNNALKNSTGDYVIMLGDDDALMKNYFLEVTNLLNQFDDPDFLYSSALLYAYPSVIPEHPDGMLHRWGNAQFLEEKKDPYILDKMDAYRIVKKSMGFKVLFNFNMQFALVARSLILELQKSGSFYQSPYPDYYAMTALLLKAKKILAVPRPLVIVGITPKSFGYFYFNQKENDGVEFLKNYPDETILEKIRHFILPGTQMNTSWLVALETVKKNFGKEYRLQVDYRKYRLLQILHYIKNYATEIHMTSKDLWNLRKFLSWWEQALYFFPLIGISWILRKSKHKQKRNTYVYQFVTALSHPTFKMKHVKKTFADVSEIIQEIHEKDYEL